MESWHEKMGRWIYFLRKALLAATALAPALFVYAVVSLTERNYFGAVALVSTGTALWYVCHFYLNRCVKHAPRERLKIGSVEAADNQALGLVLVYVLPLLTRDFSSFNFVAWAVIATFLIVVVAASYTYHFNPLLVISGWHFYKIDSEGNVKYILISKDLIRDTGYVSVGKLTEYVYVNKGGIEDA